MTANVAAAAPQQERLWEAADLYRIPLWAFAKPLEALVPVTLRFRLAKLGGIAELARSPERRTLQVVLGRHLGESDRPRLRRLVLHHFQARAKARVCDRWPMIGSFQGLEEVRVDGCEHLEAALAAGRGAILASGHFGHPRLIKPVLSVRGYRPLVCGNRMARPSTPAERPTRLGRFVRARLLRLPTDRELGERWNRAVGNDVAVGLDTGPALAALEHNTPLVLLADGRTPEAQPFPVAGIETRLEPRIVTLARKSGAAVLPTFLVDDPGVAGTATLRLVIHPPLDLQVTDDAAADTSTGLRLLAAVWERQLRSHPHNWQWSWVRDGRFDPSARRDPVGPKAFVLRDLPHVVLWLLAKPAIALAPISLHFAVAALRGRLQWHRSAYPAAADAIDRHLDGVDAAERELVARRYVAFRSRGRFVRTWPQVRNFRGAEAIRVDGLEHLDAALAEGMGAVLLSAHFGYARLVKPILGARGRRPLVVGPGAVPGRKDMPPHLTRFGSLVHTTLLRLPRASLFDERWQRTVGEDLATGLNVQPLAAALARNETLVILADGRAAQSLREVTVSGIRVLLAPGAMSLARETGAAVLPTFVVDEPGRRGPASLRLVIHPPIEIRRTGDRRSDLDENLTRFARVWEGQLRSHPHNFHWSWVRDGVFDRPD